MENDDRKVDLALESLSRREWRTPSIEQITSKEFAMNKFSRKMSRTNLALLIGGIAVLGAGTAFGAAYAMGAFKGRIVTDDGRVYDVDLNQIGDGVYGGTTAEGHQVRFMTEDATGAGGKMELYLDSPESGEFEISIDPNDLNNSWTTSEDCEEATKEITEDSGQQ